MRQDRSVTDGADTNSIFEPVSYFFLNGSARGGGDREGISLQFERRDQGSPD
jgi:hypothetical protein